nr:histidine kinase [uncultured Oscillibacter sp.]
MEKLLQSRKRSPSVFALLVSVACFLCLLLLICFFQRQQSKEEMLRMEYIARTVESETYETLLYQMEKTKVLEAHLMETGGTWDSFAPIAEILLKEPCVRSVIFAPDGVVQGVFPLESNEPVIGLDLNSDGLGNLEAQEAIRQGTLILAGPFEMVEGGLGICGRLPIYLENDSGQREYWGLVTVTLDYPDLFAENPIRHVDEQGYACRIWRINPDDNQEQTILETEHPLVEGAASLSYDMSLFNATWTICVSALTPWYQRTSLWLCLVGSVLVSLLAGFGVHSSERLRRMKAEESVRQIRTLQQQLDREQTNMLLSQISSHFFYHTLNALQALIVLKPDAAYKMAGDFSRYLRFNIDAITAAGGTVSFKEELRAVRAYADINEQQLGDRLHVVFQVPDVDFKMPALIIQPIVENAILHGIKPKVGGGTVTVTLTEEPEFWYVTVEDDGVGFDPAEQQKEQSIGLANVRKRIAQFQGCGIQIESAPGRGTKVVLRIKKIEN